MNATSLIGETVRLANPGPGEEAARYVVVQDNGDRLQIRLVCTLPIPPVETVRRADIAPIS